MILHTTSKDPFILQKGGKNSRSSECCFWVVVSNTFYFHPDRTGEMIQFDEHILQKGLVKNHQLGLVGYDVLVGPWPSIGCV